MLIIFANVACFCFCGRNESGFIVEVHKVTIASAINFINFINFQLISSRNGNDETFTNNFVFKSFSYDTRVSTEGVNKDQKYII